MLVHEVTKWSRCPHVFATVSLKAHGNTWEGRQQRWREVDTEKKYVVTDKITVSMVYLKVTFLGTKLQWRFKQLHYNLIYNLLESVLSTALNNPAKNV